MNSQELTAKLQAYASRVHKGKALKIAAFLGWGLGQETVIVHVKSLWGDDPCGAVGGADELGLHLWEALGNEWSPAHDHGLQSTFDGTGKDSVFYLFVKGTPEA